MPDADAKAPRATIHDVARAAGVSIGTVSRVINGHGRTGAATRARVNGAVESLGYRVNSIAQSMRRQSTRTVALLVHDIGNPIFAKAARSAQERLEDAGYMLVLASTGTSAASEAAAVRMLGQRRMDGIIAFLRREDDPDTLAALREFDGALVLFDRAMELRADVLLTDHAGGVVRATRYLLDLGHRAIALIGGASGIHPGRERVRGFIEAFDQYSVDRPAPGFIRTDSLEADYAFREASSLLLGAAPPTAIIAAGNQVLEGVITAIRAAGRRVPDDLSLIGFDDSAVAQLSIPPITVIARDVAQMGTMAAQMLLDRLRLGAAHPTQKVILPTEIALRESCAPLTAAALRSHHGDEAS
jgi:LacI family transcriptional regulator